MDLATAFDIFAAYETDYPLAMSTCLHIEGTYEGTSGDVAGSSGTYTIVWARETPTGHSPSMAAEVREVIGHEGTLWVQGGGLRRAHQGETQ